MRRCLLLDSIATRYHLLPSEVLNRADALDYLVMDVSTSWQRREQDLAEAKSKGVAPPAPELSINTMQQMLERVKRTDS